MIKLANLVREMKINAPSALVYKEEKGFSFLIAQNKYIFYDILISRTTNADYEYLQTIANGKTLINCSLEVESGEYLELNHNAAYLTLTIIEPGFGGGASEEEIEMAYNVFDESLAIAEQVLGPYCEKYSVQEDGIFYINTNRISNGDSLKKYL